MERPSSCHYIYPNTGANRAAPTTANPAKAGDAKPRVYVPPLTDTIAGLPNAPTAWREVAWWLCPVLLTLAIP